MFLSIAKIHELAWTTGGIILTDENRSTCRNSCPGATFSAANLSCGCLAQNASLRGERLTTNTVRKGTTLKNVSSCEKNQHGMAKPCPNVHVTSMSHVLKIEYVASLGTRLHKTPQVHSFLRFTESRNILFLAEAVHIKLNATNTQLHDLTKWSRHFSL